MLTAEVITFVMEGVLSGRISRHVARYLMHPFVAGDEPTESVTVMSVSQEIHGFGWCRDDCDEDDPNFWYISEDMMLFSINSCMVVNWANYEPYRPLFEGSTLMLRQEVRRTLTNPKIQFQFRGVANLEVVRSQRRRIVRLLP